MSIWAAGIAKRGATPGIWTALALATIIFGYAFFVDISDKISWDEEYISWRGWDYFATQPVRHKVRLDQVTEVSTANHPANFMPGRPFDRIEIASAPDTIPIMPSFHRREELEELLRYIYSRRPEAFTDPLVTQYMDGAFSEWWRYR